MDIDKISKHVAQHSRLLEETHGLEVEDRSVTDQSTGRRFPVVDSTLLLSYESSDSPEPWTSSLNMRIPTETGGVVSSTFRHPDDPHNEHKSGHFMHGHYQDPSQGWVSHDESLSDAVDTAVSKPLSGESRERNAGLMKFLVGRGQRVVVMTDDQSHEQTYQKDPRTGDLSPIEHLEK